MTLTLTIKNPDGLETGAKPEFILNRRSAMIGRCDTHDWWLPDSRASWDHWEIQFSGGRYVLHDHSSNKTYPNGGSEPLTGPYVVQNGDVFRTARYVIEARLTGEDAIDGDDEPAAPSIGFDDDVYTPLGGEPATPFDSEWDDEAGDDDPDEYPDLVRRPDTPLVEVPDDDEWDEIADTSGQAPPPAPADNFFDEEPEDDWGPVPPPSPRAPPPPAAPPPAARPARRSGSRARGRSRDLDAAGRWDRFESDHAVDYDAAGMGKPIEEGRDPFATYESEDAFDDPGLPADPYDEPYSSPLDDPGGFGGDLSDDDWDSPAPASPPPRRGRHPVEPDPYDDPYAAPPPSRPTRGRTYDNRGGGSRRPAPEGDFEDPHSARRPRRDRPRARPPERPPMQPGEQPAGKARRSGGARSAGNSRELEHLAKAFIEAAGADPSQVESLSPAMLDKSGQLLGKMVAGLFVLIQARSRAKADLGAKKTAFSANGNNPFKFEMSPEAALVALINPPGQGFMDAGQAIDEAFFDIQAHQEATIMAMRGALQASMANFSPKAIRKKVGDEGLLAKVVPASHDAELWRAYEKAYSGVVKGSDEAFLDTFAEEFKRAYEAAAPRTRD
ncbi:MAG: type VI secretion system-associated FHA domain protein TagH [Pseudomonadota bacterium]